MSIQKIKGKLVYETEWGGYVNMEPRDGKSISIRVTALLNAWWVEKQGIVLVDESITFQVGLMRKEKWSTPVLGFGPYAGIVSHFFESASVLPQAERATSLGIAVDAAIDVAESWINKLRGLVNQTDLHMQLEAARKEKEHEGHAQDEQPRG